MASYTDGLNREHAELDSTVKPVISRVRDRIMINIGGATSRVEIRGIKRDLVGELDQIRSSVTELEAKELQLTTHDTNTNGCYNNIGRITAIPTGAVNSYSQPRYIDNDVMNSRALVRVNLEEKRTPKANQYYTNSGFLLGKDRLPPESNKKLSQMALGGNTMRLMKHKHRWVFDEPVNVEGLGLHDYHAIIKHPMDLGTIKARLSQNLYKSPREFAEDVRLVFRNAMIYNPKGHDVHIIKKRNSTFYQHDDEIEVDIDNVDAESFWELERFVTNYKKNLSKQKRKDELALQARGTIRTAPVMNSAPMVAGALNSNTGKNNTSALATNAEAGRQMDNARRSLSSSSSSSDSGSSPSDSDCDSSSGSGSKVGH
ncbi:hypothetical protein KY290_000967 [Solanum tuberosum]|uniref:Bromo domain-containing protein n=1 Tax=Solanum tuberosum TaxID=4113 RepID=A0ABQ7WKV3_SOLTU|nr:hypothetical protein KY290_000967 [Solanum tuberosum]